MTYVYITAAVIFLAIAIPGVVVFMTAWKEIRRTQHRIDDAARDMRNPMPRYVEPKLRRRP